MATDYYATTWGRLRLWCSAISVVNSRTQVVHELATGDAHPAQDRGLSPDNRVRCSLLFEEMPSEALSPIERLKLVIAQVNSGAEEIFTHPLGQQFIGKAGEFTYDIDEDGNVSGASLELIPGEEITAVRATGAGVGAPAGSDAVAARAEELLAEMEAFDLEGDFPTRATETVDAWSSTDTVPTRDVVNQTAAIVDELATFIADNGLEDDLQLWSVWVAAIMFGDSVRAAAIAATSETSSIFVMRIAVPTSALALAVRVYGGAEAEERERQIRALNDLRTPSGMIASGTDLVMPALSTTQRAV